MIDVLFVLSPMLVLFLCAIFSLTYTHNIPRNQGIGQLGIIIALILNTLLLVFEREPITFNSLAINIATICINEIILFFGFIIYYSINTNLKKSHTEFFIAPNYLLFLAASIGLFLSNNMLIITTFTILATASIGILFYFGPYKKKVTSLNRYFIIIFSSMMLMLILCFIGFSIFNSLDITEWSQWMPYKSIYVQYLFFFLIFFGFGMICGIFPILNIQFEEYFRQSNPVNLRLLTTIFIPVFAFLLIKVIIPLLGFNDNLSNIGFYLCFFGIITILVLLIVELFGKNRSQSQSVFKLIGLSAILDFHIIVFLGFVSTKTSPDVQGEVLQAVMLLVVLLMAIKSLWIDSFGPIFNSTDDFNLKQIGGFYRYYPKFIIFLFAIPLIITFPFLPGSAVLSVFVNIFTSNSLSNPILNAQLWISLIVYILFIITLFILLASMINEIFFGKSEITQSEIIPKVESRFYYAPLLVIVFILLITIRELFGIHYLIPSFFEIRMILFKI